MSARGFNSTSDPSTAAVPEGCEPGRQHSSAGPSGPRALAEAGSTDSFSCLRGAVASNPLPFCMVGTLTGFTEAGAPLVRLAQSDGASVTEARQTISLGPSDVGAEVVLVTDSGAPACPIILGRLRPPAPSAVPGSANPVSVTIDGQQLVLSAAQEIVLRCGKASITLTRAGKVLIRGAYLLSRSSGVNRIKGGSVQIN
jgi:hypothetical protein